MSEGPVEDLPGNGGEEEPGGDVGEAGEPEGGSGSPEPEGDQGVPTGRAPARGAPVKQPAADEEGEDPTAAIRKALAAERSLRKERDKELVALRKAHATAEERALLEAREAGAAEATGKVRPQLMRKVAEAELRAAGVTGNTNRLVGLLNLERVELDDDGDLVGLDDQIATLKEEFPLLFGGNGGRPPAGKVAGGGANQGRKQDKSDQSQAKKGFAQQLADQVLGRT
jgi:Phage minor structural protein GP20